MPKYEDSVKRGIARSVLNFSPEGSPESLFPLLNILLEFFKVHRTVFVDIVLSEQVIEVALGAWELHVLQGSLYRMQLLLLLLHKAEAPNEFEFVHRLKLVSSVGLRMTNLKLSSV